MYRLRHIRTIPEHATNITWDVLKEQDPSISTPYRTLLPVITTDTFTTLRTVLMGIPKFTCSACITTYELHLLIRQYFEWIRMPVTVTFEFARPRQFISLHMYNCTSESYQKYYTTMRDIIGRDIIMGVMRNIPNQKLVMFINDYRTHNHSGPRNIQTQLFDEAMRRNLGLLQKAHYYLGTMKCKPIHYFMEPIHVSAFLAFRKVMIHMKGT